jgi:ribosomal protein L12E/L44/L45/RPP1/RPP2
VIPKQTLLEQLDKHQPKFSPELIKEIWKTIGLQTSDERVVKLASAMLEVQMLKIIAELRAVAPQQLNSDKEPEPKTMV